MTGKQDYAAGAVFYVRPLDGATAPLEEVHQALGGRVASGFTVGDRDDVRFQRYEDGTYEMCTYGRASTEGMRMVLRHYCWEVAREMTWDEWKGEPHRSVRRRRLREYLNGDRLAGDAQ